MIEGCFTDHQFCAEKIFAYAGNAGAQIRNVRIYEFANDTTMICIQSVNHEGILVHAQEIVPGADLRHILFAGYMRVEMMIAAQHPKH